MHFLYYKHTVNEYLMSRETLSCVQSSKTVHLIWPWFCKDSLSIHSCYLQVYKRNQKKYIYTPYSSHMIYNYINIYIKMHVFTYTRGIDWCVGDIQGLSVLGHHRAPGWVPVLYSSFPLVIYRTHASVYMSMLPSRFVPPSPSPTVPTSLLSMSASSFLPCK